MSMKIKRIRIGGEGIGTIMIIVCALSSGIFSDGGYWAFMSAILAFFLLAHEIKVSQEKPLEDKELTK